jgi:ribose-phosphate pyrophosphokinase
MSGAAEALADPAIERVVVTDTVPTSRLPAGPARDKLDILATAPLFAEAIRRLHQGRMLNDLLVF